MSTRARYHTKTARCAVLVLVIVGLFLTGCSSRTVRGTAPAPIVDVYEAASTKLTQMGYSLTEADRDRGFLEAKREDETLFEGTLQRTLRIQMESTAHETTAFEVTYTALLAGLREPKSERLSPENREELERQFIDLERRQKELVRQDAAALAAYLEGLAGRR